MFNIYNGISLKTIIEKEEIPMDKRLQEMSKRPVRPMLEINDMIVIWEEDGLK